MKQIKIFSIKNSISYFAELKEIKKLFTKKNLISMVTHI